MTLPEMVICDDETDLVDELAEWFSLKGWTVRPTSSALHALDLLSRPGHTTCLLLDRQLPFTDCNDILARIENLPAAQRPEVVAMITGNSDIEGEPRPRGVDLVFIKPVDLQEMTAAITAHLTGEAHWRLEQTGRQPLPVHAR